MGLNPEEFPDMLYSLTYNSLFYFFNTGDFGILYVIEIIQDRPPMLEIAVQILANLKQPWAQPLAAQIYNQSRGLAVPKWHLKKLNNVKPRRSLGLPNDFQPSDIHECFQLQLPREAVVFIATHADLESADFSGTVAGIDCEWKPSIRRFNPTNVALFQIAFENRVYLLDMPALISDSLLDEKLLEFLKSPTIKIGVSFQGDLTRLRASYPHMEAFRAEPQRLFDLCNLYEHMFGYAPNGLAGACELLLGRRVCKAEQTSNWERRPLRESQVHYAALDAFIQVEAFAVLSQGQEPEDLLAAEKATIPPADIPPKCKDCKGRSHATNACTKGKPCTLCARFGHGPEYCPF